MASSDHAQELADAIFLVEKHGLESTVAKVEEAKERREHRRLKLAVGTSACADTIDEAERVPPPSPPVRCDDRADRWTGSATLLG